MGKISLLIKRTDAEAMVNDDYAVRNCYLTVTEAKKDGIIKRLMPSYLTRHSLMTIQIMNKTTEGLQDHLNRQKMKVANRNSDCKLKKSIEDQAEANKTRIEAMRNQIRGYRVSTLELIRDLSKDRLAAIARTGGFTNESLTREFITYAGVLDGMNEAAKNALNDVRQTHPKFALQDLSTLTGKDRQEAENIMRASEILRRHKMAASDSQKPMIAGIIDHFLNHYQFVSPELASLIMDRPEAVDSLSGYIETHGHLSVDIETGRFKEYLDIDSRPLSAGVL